MLVYVPCFRGSRPVRRLSFCLALFVCTGFGTADTLTDTPFTIQADFPGGNIVVERIEGNTVHLRPDLRDTEGWWFYWNFRVAAVPAGQTLTFDFGERNPIGARGPAISRDGGVTWMWLGLDACNGATFTCAFPDGGAAWFAFAVPYVESDLRVFLKKGEGTSALALETLCKSADGRKVEALRAGCTGDIPRCRILLTARHHACETMASYVLEGILDAILADDSIGSWYQKNVEVLAIPFMDKDGVEEGDQGKNRHPRDHNRDYDDNSIYPETAALRDRTKDWAEGVLLVAMDLHCPYIRGKGNESIYLVGSADQVMWERQQRFGTILEHVNDSPLPYHASDNLPFGKDWNTDQNYGKGCSFARWAETIAGISLSTSMEIPYANVGGQAVTSESARAFGAAVAKAVKAYLMESCGIPDGCLKNE